MTYVLSLDVGTSSVRAALFDETGRAVPGLSAGATHAPDTTPDGGAEMDAEALLQRTLNCVDQVLTTAGERTREIAGVGLCTYWHSILGVGDDGRAATPILIWADTRSTEEVEHLKRTLDVAGVHARTGTLQHTSYVPPRLLWAARHRPEWLSTSQRWMSPGEYFYLRLFNRLGCGVSMASGTGMYHRAADTWDAEVLRALPIDIEQLSPIVPSHTPFAGLVPEFARRFPALAEIPWFPAAGDGACSNTGSGCVAPDRVALMVGTSGAMRVMREGEPPPPPAGLWRYSWDHRRYLLGGALSNGGNLFAWLRATLRVPEGEDLEDALDQVEPDSHGLTVLPFLAGERCPGWRGDARAAIAGLRWSTGPAEILRAGLESVAYRFALIHELLEGAAPPGARWEHRIIASGGALLASPAWTQMLADVLGLEVVASEEVEASGRGAALMALEGAGLIQDLTDCPVSLGRSFEPNPERHARYQAGRERQRRLYAALIEGDCP